MFQVGARYQAQRGWVYVDKIGYDAEERAVYRIGDQSYQTRLAMLQRLHCIESVSETAGTFREGIEAGLVV